MDGAYGTSKNNDGKYRHARSNMVSLQAPNTLVHMRGTRLRTEGYQ